MRHLSIAAAVIAGALGVVGQDCRCLPSDDCWPATSKWNSLNDTVDGRLVKTVPIGSPCHDPNYDLVACLALQSQWTDTKTQYVPFSDPVPSPPHRDDTLAVPMRFPSSSSIMQMFFANQSCDPFTPRDTPCELGNYVAYAVDVHTPEHVAEALKFAADNNIRVVVRNTGHDLMGRSTGAGALSIWTRHLDTTEIISNYESTGYSGPAVKLGAAVTGAQAAEFTNDHGLVVVGGECPSVGLSGGFTQGGGHSTLSTSYGMGADQVLEFDVVTADGSILKVTPEKNSDLYWAMTGGGGGNYAVVTSMTVRAHPIGDVGGASIKILANLTTPEKYSEIIRKFHALAPEMVDQGASVSYIISGIYMSFSPFTVVNSTGDYVRDVVAAPFLAALKDMGILAITEFSTLPFRDHFDKYLGPLPYGSLQSSEYQYGGRLLPRTAFENNDTTVVDTMIDLLPSIAAYAGSVGNYSSPHKVDNSLLSTWRDTLVQLQIATPWSTDPDDWDAMLASQKAMTDTIIPALKKVTPDSAAYMNEADFNEPDWKKEFYGDNYAKLLEIKEKWDPDALFYVLKGVGSDAWDVNESGKMCRSSLDYGK